MIDLNALLKALVEPLTSLGRFLNPDRQRERRKDRAIEAAGNLLDILRKEGGYSSFSEKELRKMEKHYQKQFDAWKNG